MYIINKERALLHVLLCICINYIKSQTATGLRISLREKSRWRSSMALRKDMRNLVNARIQEIENEADKIKTRTRWAGGELNKPIFVGTFYFPARDSRMKRKKKSATRAVMMYAWASVIVC